MSWVESPQISTGYGRVALLFIPSAQQAGNVCHVGRCGLADHDAGRGGGGSH
jgi:hypothetical protein